MAVTLADIDKRLALEAQGLRSPHSTVRIIAGWRCDYWLDYRLMLAAAPATAPDAPAAPATPASTAP